MHDCSQTGGQVIGVSFVGSVVKPGQHLIGQFGSHFCAHTGGHDIADVVGAGVVVVVVEQHFLGQIDRHVVVQI